LQYPTYVKDFDWNVHIKMFKKAIKINIKTNKMNNINLFSFTVKDNILECHKVKILFKII
jgi:hypothetical protein